MHELPRGFSKSHAAALKLRKRSPSKIKRKLSHWAYGSKPVRFSPPTVCLGALITTRAEFHGVA
jgi:hypothetical protein